MSRAGRALALSAMAEPPLTSPTYRRTGTPPRLAERIELAWQERWERDGTFADAQPGRRPQPGIRPDRRPAQAVRARHVPLPQRRGSARRPPARLHRHRRLRPLPADVRSQRRAHDGLRRVRPARRAVRGADRSTPPHDHRGQHRDHAAPVAADGHGLRHAPVGRHHGRALLPLDPVDLPADLQRLVRLRCRPGPTDRRPARRARRRRPRAGEGTNPSSIVRGPSSRRPSGGR